VFKGAPDGCPAAAALLAPAPLDVDALVLESVYPDVGSALWAESFLTSSA
jgi:hypothetical protein